MQNEIERIKLLADRIKNISIVLHNCCQIHFGNTLSVMHLATIIEWLHENADKLYAILSSTPDDTVILSNYRTLE